MKEDERGGIFIEKLDRQGGPKSYPAWRYHDLLEPIIVNDADEDMRAIENGYHKMIAPVTAHQSFSNFYHDLEDFNNRQLCQSAFDEFGAVLPVEAPKTKLLGAIWRIVTNSTKTKDRIVLLAHSIRMNYDETVETIRKMAGGDIYDCAEVEEKEVWL